MSAIDCLCPPIRASLMSAITCLCPPIRASICRPPVAYVLPYVPQEAFRLSFFALARLAAITPFLILKALQMSSYATYIAYSGNTTHSMLKKKRYTQLSSQMLAMMYRQLQDLDYGIDDLQIHEVAPIKIRVSRQPFRAKRHEPCVH